MYCPSCDKSYGAVHSRCPECHSWLKVSAPASSRAKSAKAGTLVEGGGVSTLDKEPTAWADSGTGGSDWGEGASDSWSDALPAPSAGKTSFPADPAPVAGSWGEGAWGSTPSGESWKNTEPAKPSMPASVPSARADSQGSGWLGGDDGWGGAGSASGLSSSPPSSLGGSGSLSDDAGDGWAGGSLASSAPVKSQGLGSTFGDDDGWGGGTDSIASRGGAASSPGLGSSQGWLGGEPASTSSEGSSGGWLGGSEPQSSLDDAGDEGWLGGASSAKAPSMTEMVDRAIGVEEADDFVDDSWVDEIDNDEFSELVEPSLDYAPQSPEIGGVFLKMLLVAVLVILIGGGVMYMGQETKSPEEIAAEKIAKELEFARSTFQTGKDFLQKGQPLLAIGPLEAAIVSLKTAGGTEKEIWDTKVELARALMKAQEYQKSYEHWAGLTKGPEEYRKEARGQMAECSKLLRLQANQQLTEAADYIRANESASVLQLGRSSLKIFEEHQGTASQKGRAHGVIGRGYFNGKDYTKARESLKRALALNPGGGYQADLNKIAQLSAPVDYYGGGYSAPAASAPAPQVVEVRASIDSDPGYAVSSHRGGGGGGSRSSASGSSGSAPSAAPADNRPRTQAIPAYRPSSGNRSNSSQRKGDKNVLPTY